MLIGGRPHINWNPQLYQANATRYVVRHLQTKLAHVCCVIDKWECGAVLARIIAGIVYASLSLFDIGESKDYIELDGTSLIISNSKIWAFAASGWMYVIPSSNSLARCRLTPLSISLPSFALLLILLNVVNAVCQLISLRD